VILDVARITYLMGDVSRGHESVARTENKDLLSDGDLEYSGEDNVRFVLTRMRMPRHTISGARLNSMRQYAPPVSAPVKHTEPSPTSK
jgi:hypothetical protein